MKGRGNIRGRLCVWRGVLRIYGKEKGRFGDEEFIFKFVFVNCGV